MPAGNGSVGSANGMARRSSLSSVNLCVHHRRSSIRPTNTATFLCATAIPKQWPLIGKLLDP